MPARAGFGVALGWGHLVDKELARGDLIRPFEHSIDTSYGYYVLLRQGADEAAHGLAQHLYRLSGAV